jgi:hypothetical protein
MNNTISRNQIDSVVGTFKAEGYKWDVIKMVKLPSDYYPLGAVDYKCVQRGGRGLTLEGPGVRIGQGFPGIVQWFEGTLRMETRGARLRPLKPLWIDMIDGECYVAGKPATHEEYMAAPRDPKLDSKLLQEAFETAYGIDDECGSKSTALYVVERHYGRAYALEVGRNI